LIWLREREGTAMLSDEVRIESFEGFVRWVEPRLRVALSASLGSEVGRDATAETLAYAWEHWPEVRAMDNPAGALYTVGRNTGRRWWRRRPVVFPAVDSQWVPWIEPELPAALARLSEQQRVVTMLMHCYEWTMSEVAELLDISESTVQSHSERGMAQLRRSMGVTQ
jgi:RNA polymerase sigma-70 factor (ECF subfamily)